MDLKGKIVFITGAAQGLGKQHITALLEKGAKIFFCDLDGPKGEATAAELSERFGSENVQFAQADVTNHARFEEVFKQAISHFGPIDIMINNAGLMHASKWQLEINVNFVATVFGTKMATEHMRKDKGGKGGRIVNVSSETGMWHFYAVATYSATKHAVRSYTTNLSLQPNLAEQGIEYALLCPAAAATDLVLKVDETKTDHISYISGHVAEAGLMKPERVTEALLDLLQREDINGYLQFVSQDVIARKAIQVVDVC